MKFKGYMASAAIIALVVLSGFSCIKTDDEAGISDRVKTITVEDYCRISKEISDMGISMYYDRLVGREYKDVKGVFAEFEKDRDDIFKAHNVTAMDLQTWKRGKHFKIVKFLKENPDIDYRSTEKQRAFNEAVAKHVYAQLNEKEDSR